MLEEWSLARASGGVLYSALVSTAPVAGSISRINADSYRCHSSSRFKRDFLWRAPRTYRRVALFAGELFSLFRIVGPLDSRIQLRTRLHVPESSSATTSANAGIQKDQ